MGFLRTFFPLDLTLIVSFCCLFVPFHLIFVFVTKPLSKEKRFTFLFGENLDLCESHDLFGRFPLNVSLFYCIEFQVLVGSNSECSFEFHYNYFKF